MMFGLNIEVKKSEIAMGKIPKTKFTLNFSTNLKNCTHCQFQWLNCSPERMASKIVKPNGGLTHDEEPLISCSSFT